MKNTFKEMVNNVDKNNDTIIMTNEFSKSTQKILLKIIFLVFMFLIFIPAFVLMKKFIDLFIDVTFYRIIELIMMGNISYLLIVAEHKAHEKCHKFGSQSLHKNGEIISKTFFLPIGKYSKKEWIVTALCPCIVNILLVILTTTLLVVLNMSPVLTIYLGLFVCITSCSNDIATVINLLLFGKNIEYIEVVPKDNIEIERNVYYILFLKK